MPILKTFLPLLIALGVLAPAVAKADVVDCTPIRARSANDRIDMRCQNINRWFIAMRANNDADHLKEMLSLLTSAILAGKTLKIYYDLQDGNGMIWAVEIFR